MLLFEHITIVKRISPFLICGCERFSVRILFAFLIRLDLPSTCPTSDNPLGVISLSLLTTYSIFQIFVFTLRVLFSQRFFYLYFTIFTLFCIVLGGRRFAESGYTQCFPNSHNQHISHNLLYYNIFFVEIQYIFTTTAVIFRILTAVYPLPYNRDN